MLSTQSDLESFHHFATGELARIGGELSLEDLLRKWREQQDESNTIASIQRGIEDANVGRLRVFSDVDATIRSELGFPARSR